MKSEAADILVVDDDRLIRTIVCDALIANGYVVEQASGGEAALARLAERDFDLVVCDLRMPEIDGFEVLRRMQRDFPGTEVIILSAHADLEAAIQCLRGGAFDLVRKEHEMMELVPAVERAVERHRLRDTSTLEAAARLIFSTHERHDLPERIVSVATRSMDADDAALMLPDINGQLYIAFSNVLPAEVQRSVRVNIGDGIAGRVAKERKPLLLHGPQPTVDGRSREVASSIVYPLHSGPDLLGVLTLNRSRADRRPFREQDVQRATILASQVVLSIENQNLMKRVTAADKFTAIGQLSTAIAHEINNPTAAILASAEHVHEHLEALFRVALVPSSADSHQALLASVGGIAGLEELCVALRDVRDGAIRIRNVVRDLRNMVRADPTSRTPFSLEAAIQAALRISNAELRSVAHLEIETAPGIVVNGCSGTISQVFVNLFMNAAYALRARGQGPGRLTVRSRRDGEWARVIVGDNGLGIAPNILARIFEPFFTTKPVGVGTGLGLAMCREIVTWHDGTMRVRSEVGVGTEFEIILPALAAGTPIMAAVDSPIPSPVVSAGRPRVLVVDDEEAICRSFSRGLVDADVVAVPGVRQALAALEENPHFTLILCDVIMPDQPGTALYDELARRFPALCRRFVFVTGSVGFADIQDYRAAHGVTVLEKPIGLAELRELVRDYAGRLPLGAARGSSLNVP